MTIEFELTKTQKMLRDGVRMVARDVIRDYVAGVLIVLENQFAIGDWVRVAGEHGEVEALNLRRTLLRTMGGDLVSVPNGDIRVVTNQTRTWARINLDIGIADPAQLPAARAAIDRAGTELAADPIIGPSVIEPPKFELVSDITESRILVVPSGLAHYGIDLDAFEVAHAVRMSMSIPFFFEPVVHAGHHFVDGGMLSNFPVWLFAAEDLSFDVTVLPLDVLRQAPLSGIDEKPMKRASLPQLRELLAEDEIAGYEAG